MAVVSVEALVKSFAGRRAVDGVSLAVEPGRIHALVGPDGAGKTTTLRMIVGLLRPERGRVRVLDEDPARSSARVRSALGYMPQRFALYGDLSVDENLAFFGEMYGLDRSTYQERRARLLALTRLSAFGARRADALSGGMYKKLALACALLPRPTVLILDEPTNGVDPVSRRELWRLLFELSGEGLAVLISTAYLDEAARAHHLAVLDHGRVILEGEPRALAADAVRRGHAVTSEDPEAVIVSALKDAHREAAR